MLRFLFPRLTAGTGDGAAAFAAVVAEARRPAWYREGGIADTVDGRFALLSALLGVVLVRLEAFGEEGDRLSARLTEQFIAAMEAEHREFGLGDPGLGKTVRKLVAMLERRVDALRLAMQGGDWQAPDPALVPGGPARAMLEAFAAKVAGRPLGAIEKGEWQ